MLGGTFQSLEKGNFYICEMTDIHRIVADNQEATNSSKGYTEHDVEYDSPALAFWLQWSWERLYGSMFNAHFGHFLTHIVLLYRELASN